MSSYCGLDFGTSNSAVAALIDSKIRLVPLGDSTIGDSIIGADTGSSLVSAGHKAIIPSAIFFNSEEKNTVFGARAIEEYVDGFVGRLMRSLKSVLGSSLMNESTQVGAGSIDYAEVIRLFVGYLKSSAESTLGRPLEQVVVGRPVYFVDNNPEADERAQDELEAIVRSAGFKAVSFEFEPIAAALDYELQLSEESLVLTMDIGGGTSDFSLMRLVPNRSRIRDPREDILAHSGVHIGGTDFDRMLSLKQVLPALGLGSQLQTGLDMPVMHFHELATWHEINKLYTKEVMASIASLKLRAQSPKLLGRFYRLLELRRGHYLAQLVEAAKVELSQTSETSVDLGFLEKSLEVAISQDQLCEATQHAVQRIMNGAEEMLKLALVKKTDVDQIVLTGGSTAMPLFEVMVKHTFPGVEVVRGDRFASIAQGLGLIAQQRYG